MEFGKLDKLSNVDWTLPPDDPSNAERLQGRGELRLYTGTPSWGHREWIGKIYPHKTPAQKFLSFYAKNFTSNELNSTHYAIPSKEQAQNWCSEVPKDFRFCPKLPKDISHASNGLLDKKLLQDWLHFLEGMESNLGPCFIQFSEFFSYNEKDSLFRFLERWPSSYKLSLELRHPSWFKGHTVMPALAKYLHERNIGLVITDVAGRREVLHSTLSSNWAFIRLIGNELAPSDERRIKDWSQRLIEWKKYNVKEAYFFLHQNDPNYAIEFAELGANIFRHNGFKEIPALTKQEEQLKLF